jgi:hypothetical protein
MRIQGPVFGLLALEIEAHDSWAAFACVHRAHLPYSAFADPSLGGAVNLRNGQLKLRA